MIKAGFSSSKERHNFFMYKRLEGRKKRAVDEKTKFFFYQLKKCDRDPLNDWPEIRSG